MGRRLDEDGGNGLRLDDMDKQIIKELQEDGRRTYGRISASVGLSEAAVRQRVQRLVETDTIRIVAVTNPDLSDSKTRATIGIRTGGGHLARISQDIAAIPEVDYIVVTAGSFDILAEAQCRDEEHLLQVLDDGIRSIPGVAGTEVFMYLRGVKQTYPWPPN